MDPTEVLGAAAQVAVTLAGFAGVVVVFGSGSIHEWSRVDLFRLRLMLTTSAVALSFCMLALLLLATAMSPAWIWGCCSAIVLLFLTPAGLQYYRAFAGFGSGDLQAAGASKGIFYTIASIGTAMLLLQLGNIIVLQTFWPFFAAIVLAILAATLQFARLILNRQEPA
jgi:hypothetical protein